MGTDKIIMLPAHLQAAARKLPSGKEHTVLELADEGDGHNASLIKVAGTCYKMGVSFDETLSFLQELYAHDRIDYATAPRRAVTRIWEGEGELVHDEESGPTLDPDRQDELLIRFRRTSVEELQSTSPHKVNIKPRSIIRKLFAPDDIINIQHTAREHGTLVKVKDLDVYKDTLHSYKFLNPSTFKKIEGVPNPNDRGKISTRCNANVKDRRFMVLEMDSKDDADVERFNTFAMTVAQFAPLVLVVDTGNRSIHFWFDTNGIKKAIIGAFFSIACAHGADKQLGVRSQIARMPNVSAAAENRGPQRVVYYDPDRENTPDGWDLAGLEAHLNSNRQLDYYYWPDKQRFYRQDTTSTWISVSRTSMLSHLAIAGYRNTRLEGETISPAEEILAQIEVERSVDAVLKGASGKHAGYYEENGSRILVAKSPRLIKPRKGEWRVTEILYRALFDHTPDQYEVMLGWISANTKDYRNGGKREARRSQTQAPHLCGPPNSGKTFIVYHHIPKLFGGRVADAEPIFKESKSQFTSSLFVSEVLFLDDTDVLGTTHHARHVYGERLKGVTVSAGGHYEQKFGDAVSIQPWWRLIRCMNEEPQTIATLPPLVEGVEDKLIILKCGSMMDCPELDTSAPGWFEKLVAVLDEELPAFLHYLLHEHQIPDHIKDPDRRFAVRSYKHPDIVGDLYESSPESYLLHKIDTDGREMFREQSEQFPFDEGEKTKEGPWKGSSNELYDLLAESGSVQSRQRFHKVCPSPKVLLAQLRVLMKNNSRIRYSRNDGTIPQKHKGNFYWQLDPPSKVSMNGGGVDLDDLL